jgi:hypothetical protein
MKKVTVLETGKKRTVFGVNTYVSAILPKDWLFMPPDGGKNDAFVSHNKIRAGTA